MSKKNPYATVKINSDGTTNKIINLDGDTSAGMKEFAHYANKELDKIVKETKKQVKKTAEKKIDKISKHKKEANRLVSMANKRLKRLESSDFKDSPAYQHWLKTGGEKFSVKGKNYNQLQSEIARMRNFIDARTSTVRGATSYLKEVAKNSGIRYSNLKELKASAPKFFELASKTEQYLRQVEDMASAIGYQKIWQQINVYVKKNRVDLTDSKLSVDDMIEEITKAITEFEKPESIDLSRVGINDNSKWFTLPKD